MFIERLKTEYFKVVLLRQMERLASERPDAEIDASICQALIEKLLLEEENLKGKVRETGRAAEILTRRAERKKNNRDKALGQAREVSSAARALERKLNLLQSDNRIKLKILLELEERFTDGACSHHVRAIVAMHSSRQSIERSAKLIDKVDGALYSARSNLQKAEARTLRFESLVGRLKTTGKVHLDMSIFEDYEQNVLRLEEIALETAPILARELSGDLSKMTAAELARAKEIFGLALAETVKFEVYFKTLLDSLTGQLLELEAVRSPGSDNVDKAIDTTRLLFAELGLERVDLATRIERLQRGLALIAKESVRLDSN